jgi:hypothetical protein
MNQKGLEVRRLGRVRYASALELQAELEAAVIAGRDRDYLLLLEHPHTFTLGRRSKNDGVLATADLLRKLGVEVFEINRGGRVTYHGPGQIVGYPIISLSPDREDVHKYVRDVEEVLIRTMSDFGIDAFRIPGLTGVHTIEGKIAAGLGEFGAVITFAANIPGETRTLPLALYTALQTPDGDALAARLAILSLSLGLAGLLVSEFLSRALRRRLGR